jgi:hypothetical protein
MSFAIDLLRGKQGERLLAQLALSYLLDGERAIEVKTDYLVARTGNFFVEREFKGRPSGIETSSAPYWALVAGESVIIIPSSKLRALCHGCRVVRGGDYHNSLGYLLPVSKLVSEFSPCGQKRGADGNDA